MAPLIIIILRFLVPFSILRWPFWGALLAMAADTVDIMLLDALGWGFFEGRDYHAIDKFFDMYYLSFEFFVVLKWKELLARNTAVVLFIWRLLGFVVFEVTRIRQVVFFAPNIFENFYLLVVGAKKFFPKFRLNTKKKLAVFIIVASVPKLIQEYIMHFLEFPTWHFIKTNIFRWR